MAKDKVYVDIVTDTQKSTKSLKKFAVGIGVATAAVAGAIAVSKKLVDAYKVQEQAEARLTATLKSTAGAAGITKNELLDMASGLQSVTKFGDEAIIGAQSLLLTFKNIGEDVFPDTLGVVLDMSEALGQDLKSSSIQVGKALNDPITGLTALQRVGITFNDTQKEMIKTMQESGNLAGAQGIILEELESQFGGVAEAAADTATGSMVQLNNAFGDLQEAMGESIAKGMQPVVKWLTEVATNAANSRKELNDFKEVLDKNFAEGTTGLDALNDDLEKLQKGLETREEQLSLISNEERGRSLELLKNQDKEYQNALRQIGAIQEAIRAEKERGDIEKEIAERGDNWGHAKLKQKQDEMAAKEALVKAIEAEMAAEERLQELLFNKLDPAEQQLQLVREELGELVEQKKVLQENGDEWSTIEAVIEQLLEKEARLKDQLKDEKEEVKALVSEGYDPLLAIHNEIAEAGAKYHEQWLEQQGEKVEALEWEKEHTLATLNAASSLTNSLNSLSSKQTNKRLSDLDEQREAAIKAAEAEGLSAEQLAEKKNAINEKYDEKEKAMKREQARRDKAAAIFSSIINTAAAIVQALPDPILATIAGIMGAAQTAIIAAEPIPAFAQGADFTTRGPQMMMVGDNPGGREHVTVTPEGSPNINGPSGGSHITVMIGEEVLYSRFTKAVRNGEIIIREEDLAS